MEKQLLKNKKIQVVFERKRHQDAYIAETTKTKYTSNGFFDMFSADIDEVYNWFGNFKVSELAFTINSIVNTQDFTRLFVGRNDDQGLKVVLKPNEDHYLNKNIEWINSKLCSKENPMNITKE